MTTKRKNIYCEIAKSEKQDDGTLIVSGFASTGEVDSDGDTITPDAMKAALPEYMKFGAVREMHQASAAGTAVSANVNEEGKTEFTAHVVDPVAVLKVETNVYKGFSIGGKVTERDPENKKVIKGLNLVEVSLVDRPANPGAVFTMYKAAGLDDENAVNELAELLDSGAVSPQQLVDLAKAATKVTNPVTETGETGTEPAKADTPTSETAQDVTKAAEPTDIKKGMYGVSNFADVLGSIGWLASDAQWEAEYEGDNSPIPAQLRQWLKDGAAIFQAMAAEEAAELVASLGAAAGEIESVTLAAKAAKADDLAKAGKKFSAANAATLGEVHKAMQDAHAGLKDACEKMAGLGYDQNDDDDAPANQGPGAKGDDGNNKAASTDDLNKAAATAVGETFEELAKAAKALGLEVSEGQLYSEVAKAAMGQALTLAKRVKELEAMPAPGKALLKALSKGEDIIDPDVNKVQAVTDSHGKEQDAATLIKAAHQAGGFRLNF